MAESSMNMMDLFKLIRHLMDLFPAVNDPGGAPWRQVGYQIATHSPPVKQRTKMKLVLALVIVASLGPTVMADDDLDVLGYVFQLVGHLLAMLGKLEMGGASQGKSVDDILNGKVREA
ncbi:hypothetical protein HDE_09851 [Halotydeus destructor]|nr:hypothetical protein HDE_09851 [Halotydeus destructor]